MQQRAEEAQQSGDWAKAMAAYDYEYEQALPAQRRELEVPRNNAAMAWIRGELARAKEALETRSPIDAFGIVSTLTREAKKRKLFKLDADEIQPVATKAVIALLPSVIEKQLAGNDAPGARREARMLLAILDARGLAEARNVASSLMRPHVVREQELAATAEAAGRNAAAYLHRALADDYALLTRTDEQQKASDDKLDNIAGHWWMTNGAVDCKTVAEMTSKWILGNKTFGELSHLRWVMTKCDIEPEVRTARELRMDDRATEDKVVGGSRKEGHYQRTEVCQDDGSCSASRTRVEWKQGEYVPGGVIRGGPRGEAPALVTYTKFRWHLEGKLIAEAPGESPVEITLAHNSSVEVESYEILGSGAIGTGLQVTLWGDKVKNALEVVEKDIRETINSATHGVAMNRASRLAKEAKEATTPEIAEDRHIAAIRAYGKDYAPAASFLEQRVGVPAGDIVALIIAGRTPVAASPLAYQLAVPQPVADVAAMASTKERVMLQVARRKSLDKNVELTAGLVRSASSTDRMGAGTGDSAFGLGVGLNYGTIVDPGMDRGVIFKAAMDFKLGYAGAFFYDASVPLALGYRAGGIGVTLLGSVGWDKFGDADDASLHINSSFYSAYGLGASLLTSSKFDLAASYLTLSRSERLAEDDLTITEEDRYEVSLLIHMSMFMAVQLTARYTQATGAMQEGNVFSISIGAVGN